MYSFKSKPSDTVTLDTNSPEFEKELQLDEFTLLGVCYVRKNSIAKKAERRRKVSPIWQFGETLVRKKDGKEVFYCYLCERGKRNQSLPILNGTGPGLEHIATHGIDKDGKPLPLKPADQKVVEFGELVMVKQFETFKRLLIRWIVYCHLAFLMVENIYFRELIEYLNKGLAGLLPQAKSTLRHWVLQEFQMQKAVIQVELSDSLSSIHLSFDLWTSPNHMAIISVFGHFLDAKGYRQKRLLAFRRIKGEHSGENQASTILEVIYDYGIEAKIGYFMADNATSNDVCVDNILCQLYPKMTAKQRQSRRLRCLGHITNLCARALLLGKRAGKALKDVEHKAAKGASAAVESFWRNRGAIGRLHNVVRYIRWSP
jgi:hypothetical protein